MVVLEKVEAEIEILPLKNHGEQDVDRCRGWVNTKYLADDHSGLHIEQRKCYMRLIGQSLCWREVSGVVLRSGHHLTLLLVTPVLAVLVVVTHLVRAEAGPVTAAEVSWLIYRRMEEQESPGDAGVVGAGNIVDEVPGMSSYGKLSGGVGEGEQGLVETEDNLPPGHGH